MSTTRTTRSGRRGFAMLEVLMAVGILALGLLPVLSLSTAGVREVAMTQEDVLVRNAGLDLLERFSREKPELLAAFEGFSLSDEEIEARLSDDAVLGAVGAPPTFEAVQSKASSMSLKRAVEFERDGGGRSGLHRLTVRLTFESSGRGERTVVMHRLLHAPAANPSLAIAPSTPPAGA